MKFLKNLKYCEKLENTVIIRHIGALFWVKNHKFWLLPQYVGVFEMMIGIFGSLVEYYDHSGRRNTIAVAVTRTGLKRSGLLIVF